ncbi:MAG: ester cyclase [Granulosicoccus sp.]
MNPVKKHLEPYLKATRCFSASNVRAALDSVFSVDADFRMCHPFAQMQGPDAFWSRCLEPLHSAMPDLERRDMIVLSGTTPEGLEWVGCMGNYMGTFIASFLDIPPTGHLAHMRYHEFYQFSDGKVVQIQCIWDIPELMMQAGAWPMSPQLGAFLCTPGPMSGDGLAASGDGQSAQGHVLAMLEDLCRFPSDPDPAIMQLEKYWHPQFNWYGPAGIGSCRGIAGFRHWHQIPFLNGMPDRKLDASADLMSHWFAEGNYVCETGWPNMRLTLSEDGWMGIPPLNKEVCLRSLDFWRLEDGLIRENWVLVDLLDVYAQVGVDVLGRVREFNKARIHGSVLLPDGLA